MISDLIKSLGGAEAVVDLIEQDSGKRLSVSGVRMWVTRNHVPYRWRALVVKEAKRRRIKIPDSVKEGVVLSA